MLVFNKNTCLYLRWDLFSIVPSTGMCTAVVHGVSDTGCAVQYCTAESAVQTNKSSPRSVSGCSALAWAFIKPKPCSALTPRASRTSHLVHKGLDAPQELETAGPRKRTAG